MKPNLEKIKTDVHSKSLDLRSLDRLLQLDSFEQAWEQASDTARVDLVRFIKSGAAGAVKKWIKHWNDRALDNLSFRRLREKASKANITNYSRMSRAQLLESLKRENENGV